MAQPVGGGVIAAPKPPDYLVPSIVACLCCFWPTGIAAIIFAMQANTAYGQGDISGAQHASRMAKIFMITSVVVGAVFFLIIIILAATGSLVATSYRRY